MNKKRYVKPLIFIIIILALVMGIIYKYTISMSNLPKGELIYTSTSNSKEYTFNGYLVNSGATVAYTVRGEIVNNKTKEKRNIYWDYHVNTVNVKWIGEKTIIVNDKKIDDINRDKYDFRNDKRYDEDYNIEHFMK